MEDVGLDKRKFFRLKLNKRAKCRILGANETQFHLLSMVDVDVDLDNLSTGGACMFCELSVGINALQENCLVQLEMMVPEMSLTGRVIWTQRTGTGIKAGLEFDAVIESERQKLMEFLRNELRFTSVN